MNYLYAQTSSGGGILGFLPFVLILLVIYFLMLRPQMKQQKDRKVMLGNLKKGDKVVTSGGIHGTITGFKEKNSTVILTVDKHVKLTVSKSAISGPSSSKEKEA